MSTARSKHGCCAGSEKSRRSAIEFPARVDRRAHCSERVSRNRKSPHCGSQHAARLLRDTHIRFGDAYSTGQIEVEGDGQFMATYPHSEPTDRSGSIANRVAGWLHRPRATRWRVTRQHSPALRSRQRLFTHCGSVKPWLTRAPTIRGAYHPRSGSIRQNGACVPQTARECRRLGGRGRLRLGQSGAAHGGRYGAKVRAFNISKEQLEFARRLARERGLEKRVEFTKTITEISTAVVTSSCRLACWTRRYH